MKDYTIAIYQPAMHSGGTAKMASVLLDFFNEMGLSTMLICEEEHLNLACFSIPSNTKVVPLPQDQYQRVQVLNNCIIHGISALIVNKKPELLDFNLFLKRGIPTYLYCHCGVEYDILKQNLYSIYAQASGILTVSLEDYNLGKALGLKSIYIPNVFDPRLKSATPVKRTKTVLWIGRLYPEEKQPQDALKIIDKLTNIDSDVDMYILGTTGDRTYDDEFRSKIVDYDLTSRVHFMGFQNNPYQFFSRSGLFLQTSQHEAFSIALLESRAYGIPTVAYSAHSSDLLKESNSGTILIEQNDIDAAVNMAYNILNDSIKWEKLQAEALSSFASYSETDFRKIWSKLLLNY